MKKVFLSYSRKNLDEVQEIARILCAGGIRIWQDIQSLGVGNTEEQIKSAIQKECAAFFIYLTEESINSIFIRENEIREAFNKRGQDSNFYIIPLINMPLAKANQKLKDILGGDISRYNGIIMPEGESPSNASRKIRTLLLKTMIEPSENRDITISLTTYSRTSGDIGPQIDLDWSRLSFPEELSSNSTWQKYLLPALMDVKDALLDTGINNIRIFSKANLTAGLAFGYIFRRETDFVLNIKQGDQWWSSQSKPATGAALKTMEESRSVESKQLGVNLSLTNKVDHSMREYIGENDISLRAELRIEPKSGPSRASVPDSLTAAAMAWEIGNTIRAARDKYNTTDIHLFASMPLGLAYLVGSELNACGRIHLYDFDSYEKRYKPSWEIGGIS